MNKQPVIGITMGDPSGIGPEIITKLFIEDNMLTFCNPMIIGDANVLSKYAGSALAIREIASPDEAEYRPGTMDVMKISSLDKKDYLPGKPTLEGGAAMVEYILSAVDMCLKGQIAAMVTCPLNKALMNKAGYSYQGHTQLISHLTDTDDYVMMLAGDKLRVTLVTIHCALREVPRMINRENILKTISITASALNKDFGIKNPRIAVTSLNPHAGEEGLFGEEEELIIRPAVRLAIEEGYNVSGPLPADTLYHRAVSGSFDAVVKRSSSLFS